MNKFMFINNSIWLSSTKQRQSTCFSKIVVIFSLILLLSGCLTTGPSDIDFTYKINATKDINPSVNNVASPVVIRIYQLSDKVAFENASYQTLLSSDLSAVSIANIKVSEYLLHPGMQTKDSMKMSQLVKFIGVAVGFRSTELVNWQQIIATPDSSFFSKSGITVDVSTLSVDLNPL